MYADAGQRAALLGLAGAVLGLVHVGTALPKLADRLDTTVLGAVTGNLVPGAWVALSLLALAGFALAAMRQPIGWPLAAIGVVAGTLREAMVGNWIRLINPIHLLAGSFWIGTLLVMMVAGLAGIPRTMHQPDRRTIVVHMFNAFTPLALVSAAVLAVFGVTTAWRHLKRLDALYTTPYGWTLIAKLCFVVTIVALGAWNWRRQRPQLGTDAGVDSIRRSATAELLVAGVVLVLTAVLVSLPSPK